MFSIDTVFLSTLNRRPWNRPPDLRSSPGFGCRIRTEPVSDPNPNLRRRIRSESEPGPAEPIRIRTWPGGTDPNPNPECRNRSESELGKITEPEPRIRTQTPPNASHLTVAGTGIRISVKVKFRRKWRALPYREPAWNQKNQDGEHKERCTHQHTEHHGYL